MRRNILPRNYAKPIEHLADGTWIIRYGILPYGTDEEGNELVTFASSTYLNKPTMDQIKKSIYRYAMSVLDEEEILLTVANPDLSVYAVVE